MQDHKTSIKSYWIAWGVLLSLTVTMIVVESASLTRTVAVLFLLAAMAFKGTIIGGRFMHLRLERRTIVLPLVLATLLTALVLYGLIAVDAAWMQSLAE